MRAAIFDMDGLLIDSEPLWQRVEQAVFREVGLALSPALCQQTTGLRVDEVVQHWYQRGPWTTPSPVEVADRLVTGVVELIRQEGQAKVGAHQALQTVRDLGLRLALASSSWPVIIEAVLEKLGIKDSFEVVHSAVDEPWGKPHPAVFLTTAQRLQVPPSSCLVFEDSLPGVRAAKAAGMTCIAIPEVPQDQRGPFGVADALFDSLLDVTPARLAALCR